MSQSPVTPCVPRPGQQVAPAQRRQAAVAGLVHRHRPERPLQRFYVVVSRRSQMLAAERVAWEGLWRDGTSTGLACGLCNALSIVSIAHRVPTARELGPLQAAVQVQTANAPQPTPSFVGAIVLLSK